MLKLSPINYQPRRFGRGPDMESSGLKTNAGFTLIEVMVSVAILGVGLVAMFAALNSNINSADLVRSNSIAAGLAQEGIEVVRNLRDNDWAAGRSFGAFGDPAVKPDDSYSVDWSSTKLGANQDNFLKKNANGLYGYASGDTTPFKRSISIITIVPNVEKRISVTITWNERGQPKLSSAEEHLFNWYRP